MSTELNATVKLYNEYLRKARKLTDYKGSGGLYSTTDDALVLIIRNRILCELKLVGGRLIRTAFPRGKEDKTVFLDPTVTNLKKSIKCMLQVQRPAA